MQAATRAVRAGKHPSTLTIASIHCRLTCTVGARAGVARRVVPKAQLLHQIRFNSTEAAASAAAAGSKKSFSKWRLFKNVVKYGFVGAIAYGGYGKCSATLKLIRKSF